MATYVKPIPVLTGNSAELFEKTIQANYENRTKVDFSKNVNMVERALEKSRKSTF